MRLFSCCCKPKQEKREEKEKPNEKTRLTSDEQQETGAGSGAVVGESTYQAADEPRGSAPSPRMAGSPSDS